MNTDGARLAVLGAVFPALALLAPGAARAGEELSDRGRKVQAAELDGPALAGGIPVLARQLRAAGLRLACLRPAYVARFDGPATVRDVVARIVRDNGLEVAWLDGGTLAVLGGRVSEAERRDLAAKLRSQDPLVWAPAMRDAAGSSDLEVFRLALAQAGADGDRAAELGRALARRWRLGLALMINEAAGLALAQRALADGEEDVRRGAMGALEDYGGPKSAALVGRVIDAGRREIIDQLEAFAVLERIGGPEAVKVFDKVLAHKDRELASRAVDSLGRLGGPESAKALEKALGDEGLVPQALEALAVMGGPEAVKVLARALANAKVGHQAVGGLERVGGADSRDALIAHLDVERKNLDFRRELERVLAEKYPDDDKAKAALKKAGELDKKIEAEENAGEGGGEAPPAPAPPRPRAARSSDRPEAGARLSRPGTRSSRTSARGPSSRGRPAGGRGCIRRAPG